jgi:hypothetical protein
MLQDLGDKLLTATTLLKNTNNAAEICELCKVVTAIAEAIASMRRLL